MVNKDNHEQKKKIIYIKTTTIYNIYLNGWKKGWWFDYPPITSFITLPIKAHQPAVYLGSNKEIKIK